MSETNILGALLSTGDGDVGPAVGLCRDPRIQALAADPEWIGEARMRRLQLLTLDNRRYAVMVTPINEGYLLVITEGREPLLEFVGSVDFAFDILTYLLTDPFEGMSVVDSKGRLVYLSPIHESFFGLRHGEAIGRPVDSVIENTQLHRVVKNGKAEIGAIQKMQGIERIVSRVPLRRGGEVVGAIGRIMFKGPQQLQELSQRHNQLKSQVSFYQQEAATLRRHSYGLDAIIGESAAVRRLRSEIVKLAPLDTPILILGDSGTGKELIAHALHTLSARRDSQLVTLNASAMPSTLVEAELFGYEAGSFTGADRKGRKGKFEQAHGGTILLDEIGDLPLEVQPKLLRVLQDRVIERIGGDKSQAVDFRLVCATNADLRNLVSTGKFRLDLFYRISVITLEAPPLRARLEDIPLLVEHFLRDLAAHHSRSQPEVTDDAIEWLMEQKWPGNIRQLRHEVERAFVFCENDRIDADLLTRYAQDELPGDLGLDMRHGHAFGLTTLKEATDRMEIELIAAALERNNGNKKKVAEELGISRSYLYKRLEEAGAMSREGRAAPAGRGPATL